MKLFKNSGRTDRESFQINSYIPISLCLLFTLASCNAMHDTNTNILTLNGVMTHVERSIDADNMATYDIRLQDGLHLHAQARALGHIQIWYAQPIGPHILSPLQEVDNDMLESLYPNYKLFSDVPWNWIIPCRKFIATADATYVQKNPDAMPRSHPAHCFDEDIEDQ